MVDFEEKRLLLNDVAKFLGLTLNTVQGRRWQVSSGCPIRKKGGRCFVLREEFEKWLRK